MNKKDWKGDTVKKSYATPKHMKKRECENAGEEMSWLDQRILVKVT